LFVISRSRRKARSRAVFSRSVCWRALYSAIALLPSMCASSFRLKSASGVLRAHDDFFLSLLMQQ